MNKTEQKLLCFYLIFFFSSFVVYFMMISEWFYDIFFFFIFSLRLVHYLSYNFRFTLSWNCHKLVKVIFSVRRYASVHVMLSVRNEMSENVYNLNTAAVFRNWNLKPLPLLEFVCWQPFTWWNAFVFINRIFVSTIFTEIHANRLSTHTTIYHWNWHHIEMMTLANFLPLQTKSVCIRLFLMNAEINRVSSFCWSNKRWCYSNRLWTTQLRANQHSSTSM